MIKSVQVLLALLVPSVLVVTAVRAGGDQDKSPNYVFNSFVAATKKEDAKAVMSQVTHDSQSSIAGTILLAASIERTFTGFTIFGDRKLTLKEKEHIDAIDEVLNRHGVSEDDVLKKLNTDHTKLTKDHERTDPLVAAGELVKDKAAFVSEILKVCTGVKISDMGKEITEAKLNEVRIDGQGAKGHVTILGADGEEKSAAIYFKLENGAWKIDLAESYRHWPPPPAPPQPQVQPPANQHDSRPGLLRRLFRRLCDR